MKPARPLLVPLLFSFIACGGDQELDQLASENRCDNNTAVGETIVSDGRHFVCERPAGHSCWSPETEDTSMWTCVSGCDGWEGNCSQAAIPGECERVEQECSVQTGVNRYRASLDGSSVMCTNDYTNAFMWATMRVPQSPAIGAPGSEQCFTCSGRGTPNAGWTAVDPANCIDCSARTRGQACAVERFADSSASVNNLDERAILEGEVHAYPFHCSSAISWYQVPGDSQSGTELATGRWDRAGENCYVCGREGWERATDAGACPALQAPR